MGKATTLDGLLERALTKTESDERRRAEQVGDADIEATLDGELRKRTRPNAPSVVVQERQTGLWD
jgi:hypothetical protein